MLRAKTGRRRGGLLLNALAREPMPLFARSIVAEQTKGMYDEKVE
jgi:hypothetical protein